MKRIGVLVLGFIVATGVLAKTDISSVDTYAPAWYKWRPNGVVSSADAGNMDYAHVNVACLAFLFLGDGAVGEESQTPYTVFYHERVYGPELAQHIKNTAQGPLCVGVGGWTHETRGFVDLINNEAASDEFIRSVEILMKEVGATVLDFDWEYPGDLSRGGTEQDKEKFPAFLQKVKSALSASIDGYMQTIAVGVAPKHLEFGYDIEAIYQAVDEVKLMTYDMYGNFYPQMIYHNAPWENEYEQIGFSMLEAIDLWTQHDAARLAKTSVGLATYGRGVGCINKDECRPGVEGVPTNVLGPLSLEAGFMDYQELVWGLEQKSFTLLNAWYNDVPHTVSAILEMDGTFVHYSFDDEITLCKKTNLIKNLNINNVFTWHIYGDLDNILHNSIISAWSEDSEHCPHTDILGNYPIVPPFLAKYLDHGYIPVIPNDDDNTTAPIDPVSPIDPVAPIDPNDCAMLIKEIVVKCMSDVVMCGDEVQPNGYCPLIPGDDTNTTAPIIPDDGTNTTAPIIPDDGTNSTAPIIPDDGTNSTAPIIPDDGTNSTAPIIPDDGTNIRKWILRRIGRMYLRWGGNRPLYVQQVSILAMYFFGSGLPNVLSRKFGI